MLEPDKSNARLNTHAANSFEIPVNPIGPDRNVPRVGRKSRPVLAHSSDRSREDIRGPKGMIWRS